MGKDFWKGAEASPYCNIKLRKSFLPRNEIPLNSETSRSSQLAAENNSVIEHSWLKAELVVDNPG